MWRKPNQPAAPYPVAGRILNRHKRGRPRFKFLQRFKSRAVKLVIPLAIFGVIGFLVWLANSFGLI